MGSPLVGFSTKNCVAGAILAQAKNHHRHTVFQKQGRKVMRQKQKRPTEVSLF
jgi:hypothetical protein